MMALSEDSTGLFTTYEPSCSAFCIGGSLLCIMKILYPRFTSSCVDITCTLWVLPHTLDVQHSTGFFKHYSSTSKVHATVPQNAVGQRLRAGQARPCISWIRNELHLLHLQMPYWVRCACQTLGSSSPTQTQSGRAQRLTSSSENRCARNSSTSPL